MISLQAPVSGEAVAAVGSGLQWAVAMLDHGLDSRMRAMERNRSDDFVADHLRCQILVSKRSAMPVRERLEIDELQFVGQHRVPTVDVAAARFDVPQACPGTIEQLVAFFADGHLAGSRRRPPHL